MAGIRLSEKFGANPMMVTCTWCGKETNEIALLGLIGKKTAKAIGARYHTHDGYEAPRSGPISDQPCESCEAGMAQGITFIEVTSEPRFRGDAVDRTGRWWVLKEEAVRRFVTEPMLTDLLSSRKCYIDSETADRIGFDHELEESDADAEE